MRQIKYIIIDDCATNREHHYNINSKGFVTESIDIRKPVKVIDQQVDLDGYNTNSISILFKEFKGSNSSRESLKDLLAELRSHFPEALIFGIKEIGEYYIKASDEMNRLRFELSGLN